MPRCPVRDQGVAGSNPVSPTHGSLGFRKESEAFCLLGPGRPAATKIRPKPELNCSSLRTASCVEPGARCMYRSVVVMDACPAMSLMTRVGTPAIAILVQKVWRRMWMLPVTSTPARRCSRSIPALERAVPDAVLRVRPVPPVIGVSPEHALAADVPVLPQRRCKPPGHLDPPRPAALRRGEAALRLGPLDVDEVPGEVDVALLERGDLAPPEAGLAAQEDEEVGAGVELLGDLHELLEHLGLVELDLGGDGRAAGT
jgi:hypothetical protein